MDGEPCSAMYHKCFLTQYSKICFRLCQWDPNSRAWCDFALDSAFWWNLGQYPVFKFQKYLKGGTCGIPYLHVFLLRKQFLLTKKYRTSEVFLAISTFPSSAFSQSSIDFKNFSEALWVFSDLCSWVTHIVARSKNSLKKDSSILEVPPRFELGSLDSKSKVLTITPWDRAYKLSYPVLIIMACWWRLFTKTSPYPAGRPLFRKISKLSLPAT